MIKLRKYAKFLEDVYDGDKLVFKKDEKYPIAFEGIHNDIEIYMFDKPEGYEVSKKQDRPLYEIIEEED